jgi:undecaprenyl-diphosphatase
LPRYTHLAHQLKPSAHHSPAPTHDWMMVITDLPLFLAINDFARATPWLHTIVLTYANAGIVVFAALMAAGWWTARAKADPTLMTRAIWAPLGMLIALGANQVIVAAVNEPRPYAALPDILVLAQRGHDPSFPSDHAVMAGAVAAALFTVNRRLGWSAAVAAALMVFARVYIGAHYPHDVAAGLGVGAAVSALAYLGLHRLLARLLTVLVHTPLRPLLTSSPPDTQTA